MVGFRKKLEESVEACGREGLVCVPDAGLEDFATRRFPKLRRGRGVQLVRTPEFFAGQVAGKSIVLHKPIRSDPGGPTRLLGS